MIRPYMGGSGMKRMYIDGGSGRIYNGYPARKSTMHSQKNRQLSREKRHMKKSVAEKIEQKEEKKHEKEQEESGSGAKSHMWSQKPKKRIGASK